MTAYNSSLNREHDHRRASTSNSAAAATLGARLFIGARFHRRARALKLAMRH
jgi:hypothetical protein